MFALHAQDYFQVRPSAAKVMAYALGSGLLISGITHQVWHAGDDHVFKGFSCSNQKFQTFDFVQGFIKGAFFSALPTAITYVALKDVDKKTYPIVGFDLLSLSTVGCVSAAHGLSKSFFDVWRAARDYRHRIKYLHIRNESSSDGKIAYRLINKVKNNNGKGDQGAFLHAQRVLRHVMGDRRELNNVISAEQGVGEIPDNVTQQWVKAEKLAKAESDASYFSYSCGKLAGTLTTIATIGGVVGWGLYNFLAGM